MNRLNAHRGFTLIEIVVAITISAIVMVFVSMFMAAPLEANAAQSRRAAQVAGLSDAWPRLERDLRVALPNSIRTRRNGAFVAVELLRVEGEARYVPPIGATFVAWGTTTGVFLGAPPPYAYLSVNNRGTAGADAYALAGSMTAAGATITVTPVGPGEASVTVSSPAPTFAAESPRHRVYGVSGPVTYLCDETQGTLQRFAGYPVALSQASWDTAGEFAGAGVTGELIARGLTACLFDVSAPGGTTAQTVAVHLTSTAANGDNVTLLHSYRAEYVP